MFDLLRTYLTFLPDPVTTTVVILIQIVMIVIPIMLSVAYLTFAERKIIGYIQVRIGPNRVGPRGWLQPIADALKLLCKEVIIPAGADRLLGAAGTELVVKVSGF